MDCPNFGRLLAALRHPRAAREPDETARPAEPKAGRLGCFGRVSGPAVGETISPPYRGLFRLFRPLQSDCFGVVSPCFMGCFALFRLFRA
jgi:hypothetical protein